jgi:hypothetical protein
VQAISPEYLFFRDAPVQAIDADRLVVTTGPRIQLRDVNGALIDESAYDFDPDFTTRMSCGGIYCAIANGPKAVLVDSGDMQSTTTIALKATAQYGPNRAVQPSNVFVACDAAGVCLASWMLEDTTWHGDYSSVEYLGAYARPFDVATGTLGEEIRLQGIDSGTTSVMVASIGSGQFVVAVDGYSGFTVHRVDVR